MGAGKKEQARDITAFPTTTTLFRVQTHHRPSLHAWKDRENRAQDKKKVGLHRFHKRKRRRIAFAGRAYIAAHAA